MSSLSLSARREKWQLRAREAEGKPAAFGRDLELKAAAEGEEKAPLKSLQDLERRTREASLLAGVTADEKGRSGSFYQQGDSVLYQQVQNAYQGQVEIMSIERALDTYDWLWDYWWSLVPVDMDKYTAHVELYGQGGYFIRIREGAQVDLPIQSCLLLDESGASQRVHNIIIAEKGSRAQIITGCTLAPEVSTGLHLGVSEFFIREDAHLTFTMVHNWAEEFHVRPRTGVTVGSNAAFINNYLLLKPVRSIQSNPRTILEGDGARTRFNAIISGQKDSEMDLGSVIELNGAHTRAESISRALGADDSRIMMRGRLQARDNTARAHLECKGMLLSEQAQMNAVPELWVEGAPQAHLSHEAAVGPISAEAVEYLMSRGIPEETAVAAIIHGFMKLGIEGLPEVLEGLMEKTLDSLARATL